MANSSLRPGRPLLLTEIVAGVLAPVSDRRSFALASLAAAWPELVGPRYADSTHPERIDWPRGGAAQAAGTLRVRAQGPRAVLLQHELDQLVQRINAFFGHGAIDRIRLVQGAVPRRRPALPAAKPAVDETRLANAVADVGDDTLRQALARLGRGILGERS
jgi:hypothetical protein